VTTAGQRPRTRAAAPARPPSGAGQRDGWHAAAQRRRRRRTRGFPSAFAVKMTPLTRRLEGSGSPCSSCATARWMPDQWLSFGSRTIVGNETKVVFGGQAMGARENAHRRDCHPDGLDYLNLDGKQAGTVSRGIMEWVGDEVRFLIAGPGQPRPSDFSVKLATGTLSQWRRR